MKERIKVFTQVLLMLSICLAVITLAYLGKGNDPKAEDLSDIDTIPIEPIFMTQPPEEGLMEALGYYGIEHPEIVHAQAILETGYFKSNVCVNKNNLFGLYNSRKKTYYEFDHWSESIKAYRDWIQRRYNPPQDYYKFLESINYASDPLYTHKLKIIVKENGKRRYTEGDTIPEGK